MKHVLITVKNILKMEILTEICDTKEEAYGKMKDALLKRLKMDGDEDFMPLLKNGVEFSNVVLHETDAYIFQDTGKTSHHWKIIEV